MENRQQVVIVTGAGRGIGACIAQGFADKGAAVIVAERNEQDGLETAQAIVNKGGRSLFIQTDVGKPDEIVRLMEKSVAAFGTIDILINNAGVSRWKSPYELEVAEWDEIIETNLRSVFLCSREAAKIMRKNGGGAIVNIASTRAHMSEPDSEAYAATKGGILALTHALAISLGADGIRVNAISPGWIETGDRELLRELDNLQHPAQRVGTPADIVRACQFLSHPDNDFVTGTELIVDGGMTRKMIYEP